MPFKMETPDYEACGFKAKTR